LISLKSNATLGTNLKILIYGIGGVGGYIASKLIQNGFDVDLCARGNHLAKVKSNGLIVIDNGIATASKVNNISSSPTGKYDIILLCVKGYDIKEASKNIKLHIAKNGIVIPIANGIENDIKVKNTLGKANVANSCIYIISHLKEPGIIKRDSDIFHLFLPKAHKACVKLAEILQSCNLKTSLVDDIELQVWKKFTFIAVFGSLTSFFDQSIGYVVEHKKDMTKQALKEVQLLAKLKGVELDDRFLQKQIDIAKKVPYDSTTSMRLDFQNKKKTEVEELCGFVYKELKNNKKNSEVFKTIYNKMI
jgi:2-dehydropantoate 2-reductase